jgi:hypothetical protein
MLNANQERFLRATLGVVEGELMNLRRLLLMDEEERLFLHTVDDLTQQEKQRLIEKMERLREYMLHLKNLFGLNPGERSARRMVKAASVYLAVDLEETMSDRLRGRGEVAPDVKETLDPVLKKMVSLVRDMEFCLESDS